MPHSGSFNPVAGSTSVGMSCWAWLCSVTVCRVHVPFDSEGRDISRSIIQLVYYFCTQLAAVLVVAGLSPIRLLQGSQKI